MCAFTREVKSAKIPVSNQRRCDKVWRKGRVALCARARD